MNKKLITNLNDRVGEDDELWVVGDIAMLGPQHMERIEKVLSQINGSKHLVAGNHDRWRIQTYRNAGFTTVHSSMWFDYGEHTFYMMHDPAEYSVIENNPKAVMLCGHIHGLFKHLLPAKRIINVGVDVWDLKPVNFDEITNLLIEFGTFKEKEVDG